MNTQNNTSENDKIYPTTLEASFHEEYWYKLSCCGETAEFYQTESTNEKGVRLCPYCGKKVRID